MKAALVALCVWLLSKWAPEKLRPVKPTIAPDAYSWPASGSFAHCVACSRSIAGVETAYWNKPANVDGFFVEAKSICRNCWQLVHGFPS
jgi:hypothetical protein